MRCGVHSRASFAILGAVSLIVTGLLFAPIPSGQATGDPDFAGFYEVSNVVDQGSDVQITFAVRVFNYADYDVAGATVKLCDSNVSDVAYGTFSSVDIAQGQSVVLRGTITLPHQEFDSWQSTEAGGGPHLWIEFTDAGGNPVRERVELVSAPVGEDN